MADETALFESRRAALDGREKILARRIAQLEEENLGFEAIIAAQDDKLALISREIADVKVLYSKGLARLPRLLELQRTRADIQAERAKREADIARNRQKIGETEMQRLTLYDEERKSVGEELTKIRGEIAVARSQLPSRVDVLERTLIRAPIAGRVMNVRVTTEAGGVLKPGAPILDIVPEHGGVVIDARIRPVDIDVVKPGMKARVLLTAYRQRSMPQVHGRLRSVSADRLVDEKSGEPYFLAEVEVSPEELKKGDRDIRLLPGMPVEIMVLTGERTLMDYLLRPLVESFVRSFRES
jgi:HlyD family type I secretion membrane fusion protein